MTETSTTESRGAGRGASKARGGNPVSRLFAGIGLYIRQIIDEMRKVVWPTRQELISYTGVVLAFLAVIMAYILGLDQLFQRLVSWAFGTG